MREHMGIFRGKRIDNGEWVEGNLVSYSTQIPWAHIVWFDNSEEWVIRRFEKDVDPETIGECTGLKDKNGKLIFEGDVISSSWGYKGVVEFDEIMYAKLECLFNEDCEVTGNIHDNPELLKGGEG